MRLIEDLLRASTSEVSFIVLYIVALPLLVGSLSYAVPFTVVTKNLWSFKADTFFSQGSACKPECKSLKVTD